MKKLLQVSAVLIAAVLLFAGCKNNADDDSLPGNWKSDIQYYNGTETAYKWISNTDKVAIGTVTWDGQGGAVYHNETPSDPNAGTENALIAGYYNGTAYGFMSSDYSDLTGFEATASSATTTPYGFCFNIHASANSGWTDYYDLQFNGQTFKLTKRVNSTTTTIQSWKTATAIKAQSNTNNVTVYKDGDSIIIKVNGSHIYTIENPEITEGFIAFDCNYSYEDVHNQTPITMTYKINQVQYK